MSGPVASHSSSGRSSMGTHAFQPIDKIYSHSSPSYHEGFDSRCCLNKDPNAQENTHDQKMAQMNKHK